MRFTCTRDNFHKGLSFVGHIANKSVTLPILENLLIEAREGEIVISATNLEIGVQTKVRGKVDEVGSVTIPAKLLLDYISLLREEKIEVFLDDKVINISGGNYKTKIHTIPADEFPIIPILSKKESIVLSLSQMRTALSSVIFAASTDETRPELSGVYLSIGNKEIVFAATDSYRLAERKFKLDSGSIELKSIIPLRSAHELVRIMGDVDGEIEVVLEKNQLMATIKDTIIVSRLIDGQYPDYSQIIPTSNLIHIEIDRQEIIDAVKIAGLFTKKGINDIEFRANIDENMITVSTTNTQLGENVTQVAAAITGDMNTGDMGKVIFNWRYLLDGLQSISTRNVSFDLNDSSSPGIIRPVYDKDKTKKYSSDDYLYLIMPIKQ